MAFVPIHNKDRAKQLIRFDGMQLGAKVWPTDFDAVIEWKDKAWLLFEVKHSDALFPLGQRLALERFVADVWKSGKAAMAAVVEHDVADAGKDVFLADCQVREIFVGGEFKWRAPRRRITARECMDAYIGYAEGRCA